MEAGCWRRSAQRAVLSVVKKTVRLSESRKRWRHYAEASCCEVSAAAKSIEARRRELRNSNRKAEYEILARLSTSRNSMNTCLLNKYIAYAPFDLLMRR